MEFIGMVVNTFFTVLGWFGKIIGGIFMAFFSALLSWL